MAQQAHEPIQDPLVFGKVAVLMGGQSSEREISLQTGNAVLQALQRRGVDAHAIDAGDDVVQDLLDGAFQRAFIALHGRGGEDGVIQGALQALGLPYTGSGVLGSALAMDKCRTKRLWQGEGLPTPPFHVLHSEADCRDALDVLGLPLIIKPGHEGSSVGMTKVAAAEQLVSAWRRAAGFDATVIAERWIDGGEYTVGILGDQALPLIGLKTPHEFYDYAAKYQVETTTYRCPSGLSAEQETQLQQLALRAFAAVDASGWGRVDLMVDGTGQPWLIEVNTVPGMTDHSLVPMAARQAGIEFDELVWRIMATSLERRA